MKATNENLIATEDHKGYVHCPKCDKMLIQAAVLIDGIIKCDKCHRRYALSIQECNVSIKHISKSKDAD